MIKKLTLALLAFFVLSPAYVFAATGTIPVNVDGTSVDVSYDATGVEILGVVPDLDFISLIFEVNVTGSPGILEITLDRDFFDSIYQGADDLFIVLADGDEPNFEEIVTTYKIRILSIEVPSGTEEIEIIGTVFGEPEPVNAIPAPEPEPEPAPAPQPKTQCGPGTVLKDGVCVLDEKCGPGTILQDGVCVVLPSASAGKVSISKDLIVGAGTALVIAFILIIIFAAISRVSRT